MKKEGITIEFKIFTAVLLDGIISFRLIEHFNVENTGHM